MSLDRGDTHYEMIEQAETGDSGERDVSTTIVLAVARASGTPPTDLPPLYDYVDPEALDALVAHSTGRPDRTDLTITFSFSGYEVTVHEDGEVVVSQPVETV